MLYTVGHGNKSWEDVNSILKMYQCKYLIDVRSNPRSKYNTDFNTEALQKLCADSGIAYVFMGDSIGGKPAENRFYTPSGHVSYEKISNSKKFLDGIERVVGASRLSENTFLMCSESDPRDCHRTKLIGEALKNLGIDILHIDKDLSLKNQNSIISDIVGGQSDLFGDSPKTSFSKGKYK